MKRLAEIFLVAAVLLFALTDVYAGGGNRTGTGGASQLLLPVGTRGIAMGGANAALSNGLEGLFWNPAAAARSLHSTSVVFSHMNYLADIGVEYGGVSTNFEGFGVLSFTVKSLSIGDIPVTTAIDPDGTGKTFSPQMLNAGLSYSRQLTDRISVGATATLLTESLGDVSATGMSFNIGVLYENLADLSGLNLGVVIKNLGPSMQYDGSGLYREALVADFNRSASLYKITSAPFELPSSFEIGFGYTPMLDRMNALTVSTSFQNNNFSGDEYKFGLEYGWDKMLFLRAGYALSPENQTPDYIYGFTAGAGIDYNLEGISVAVDYAYRDVKYFGGNHVFELSLGF